MLMRADNGTIDEHVGRHLTPLGLEAFPELPPDPSGFPPATAVVDGIPMAKLVGQITSGEASASEIEDGFDELTVTQLGGLPALCLSALSSGSISPQASSISSLWTGIGVSL